MNPVPVGAVKTAVTLFEMVGGVAFVLFWLAAASAWAVMSMTANLMANDSGAATGAQHMTLIVGMGVGELVVAAAAIPGGLAFFWVDHRSLLIWIFVGMVVIGAAIQVWAFRTFFAAMG